MKTYTLPFIGSLIISLLHGIVSGVFGSFLASLFFPNFVFGNLVGYEAGGIALFLFGLTISGVYSALFLARHLLKSLSQKLLISFIVIFYSVSALLWIICDMFHLPHGTQIAVLILAWLIPPIFVLWRQK